MTDLDYFTRWQASEKRVAQLQSELTCNKSSNTVANTQPPTTVHGALATYDDDAPSASQSLPRDRIQQLVKALKSASKGTNTIAPRPAESQLAALQAQVDTLSKCVIANRNVLQGMHTRLEKLEDRVDEMDVADGKAVRILGASHTRRC